MRATQQLQYAIYGVFDLAGAPFWVQVKLAQDSALAEAEDREGRLIGLFAMTPAK